MSHGWSQERREKQSKLIRTWRPWNKSTGPKSVTGKETSSMNAFKHGAYTKESLAAVRHARLMIKLSKFNLSEIEKFNFEGRE